MKKILKWGGIGLVILIVIGIIISATSPAAKRGYEDGRQAESQSVSERNQEAIAVVARDLSANTTGISINTSDLETKPNPKGNGTFVYHPDTEFSGVERYLIWLVIEDAAYPLNGASKDITPNLQWPREVDDETWNETGLDKFQATDAIELVFGAN
jgi:hypothetical protein